MNHELWMGWDGWEWDGTWKAWGEWGATCTLSIGKGGYARIDLAPRPARTAGSSRARRQGGWRGR